MFGYEEHLHNTTGKYFRPLEGYHRIQNLQILPGSNKISKLANTIFSGLYTLAYAPIFFIYSSILVLAFNNKPIKAKHLLWGDSKLTHADFLNITCLPKTDFSDVAIKKLNHFSSNISSITLSDDVYHSRTVKIEFNSSITSFFKKVINLMFNNEIDLSKIHLLLAEKNDPDTIKTFKKISEIFSKLEIFYGKGQAETISALYL
jgi:hypothetical protein